MKDKDFINTSQIYFNDPIISSLLYDLGPAVRDGGTVTWMARRNGHVRYARLQDRFYLNCRVLALRVSLHLQSNLTLQLHYDN